MTTPPQQPAGPQINIPEGLEPAYVNLARISHSPADIVIDFAHILPGESIANIRTRVVMTPLSAKLLLRASMKTWPATKPPSVKSKCPVIIRLQRISSAGSSRQSPQSRQKNNSLFSGKESKQHSFFGDHYSY